jgi:hypothetical protein
MDSAYILFGIAVLSIILGFVALLSQKIYLDATTKEPTEVEVPFLGKIRSNYPALVFVFLGVALAFYAFQRSYPPKKEMWNLEGFFTPPDGKTVDRAGALELRGPDPIVVKNTIDDDKTGHFQIWVNIPEGKSVEQVFETLNYTYSDGSAYIDLKDKSTVDKSMEHQRIFKKVPITVYQSSDTN